jgi:hypothetical protein
MGISLGADLAAIIALFVLLLSAVLLWWFALRIRKGNQYAFRRIAAFGVLKNLLLSVSETGKKVHVSLGRGGIGSDQTAVASAGLVVLDYLAEQGASMGISPTITVADPTMLLAAQDALYRAYVRKGRARHYLPTSVQFVAPDPAAYATGAQLVLDDERVAANVMVGQFGDEYLMIGETGSQRDLVQVVGSNAVDPQPFMVATTEYSLGVQDVLRVIAVVAILVGVIGKTVLGW